VGHASGLMRRLAAVVPAPEMSAAVTAPPAAEARGPDTYQPVKPEEESNAPLGGADPSEATVFFVVREAPRGYGPSPLQ
jgi:hypothetical protein